MELAVVQRLADLEAVVFEQVEVKVVGPFVVGEIKDPLLDLQEQRQELVSVLNPDLGTDLLAGNQEDNLSC